MEVNDLTEYQKEMAKIRQSAYKKGEEALSVIQKANFNPGEVVTNTLVSMIPGLLLNFAIANVNQNFTFIKDKKFLNNLDTNYNSVECFPPENERIPLYDENGCLTRVPFPDELKVSPIDQHGTCGICIED